MKIMKYLAISALIFVSYNFIIVNAADVIEEQIIAQQLAVDSNLEQNKPQPTLFEEKASIVEQIAPEQVAAFNEEKIALQEPQVTPIVEEKSLVIEEQQPIAVQEPAAEQLGAEQVVEKVMQPEQVTVVKVYPVFDAAKNAYQHIKAAAESMINYFYSFFNKA